MISDYRFSFVPPRHKMYFGGKFQRALLPLSCHAHHTRLLLYEKCDSVSLAEWSCEECNIAWKTTEIFKWCGVLWVCSWTILILKWFTYPDSCYLLAPCWTQGYSFQRLASSFQWKLSYTGGGRPSGISFAQKYFYQV